MAYLAPWVPTFEMRDAWISSPHGALVFGLFYASAAVGFVLTWLWRRLR